MDVREKTAGLDNEAEYNRLREELAKAKQESQYLREELKNKETDMDVRGKLVEILRKPIFPHELVDPIEAVADYLLDNDVVPVVRCKDCKWGKTPYGDERDGWTECTNIYGRPLMSDEGFCYFGERRSNEGSGDCI